MPPLCDGQSVRRRRVQICVLCLPTEMNGWQADLFGMEADPRDGLQIYPWRTVFE
ncbi:hypothetical protein Tsubulata_009314 [Turnera subulata]|uniref:Uncharacterized protein n=1 Tax=Turnera subulata TaxID=218843 RepID=A0A9Q0FGF0_9ROSI|nr:hypothetical protein Tsubulata_009314 [Turnera subulata]